MDSLGRTLRPLKCDNEPGTLAPPALEIRRLRRGSSITILEHPEEEMQDNHLAEGSVDIVKGFIRTLKSSTESNLRTTIGPSHPLIPLIIEHAAQLKNRNTVGCRRQNSDREAERQRSSASCVCAWQESLVLTSCSCPGSTTGSAWAADHSTARRTSEHPLE